MKYKLLILVIALFSFRTDTLNDEKNSILLNCYHPYGTITLNSLSITGSDLVTIKNTYRYLLTVVALDVSNNFKLIIYGQKSDKTYDNLIYNSATGMGYFHYTATSVP